MEGAVRVGVIQGARHSTSHALALPGLTRQPMEPLASSLRAGRWTRVSSPRVTTGGVACEPLLPPVPRLRLGEDVGEEIVDQHVVLLLEPRVRDAGHDGVLLVSVGQLLEEAGEILDAGAAIVRSAPDAGWQRDL